MKRIILFATMLALFIACEKPTPSPQEVNITLAYSLDTSVGESMTRASDSELWGKFYAKMKTGELVAESYTLTFTEKTTGAKYEFNGKWADNDIVTIKTGNYIVEGTSRPEKATYIQEQASLTFNAEITISAAQTSLVLPAQYDCFLLAFYKSNITNMSNSVTYDSNMGGVSGESVSFYSFENHYYAFSRKLYNDKYADRCYIKGKREDGSTFTIYTSGLAFEKGKYYFYTDASSIFSLPEMTTGE